MTLRSLRTTRGQTRARTGTLAQPKKAIINQHERHRVRELERLGNLSSGTKLNKFSYITQPFHSLRPLIPPNPITCRLPTIKLPTTSNMSSLQLLPLPFDIANSALVTSKYPALAKDVERNYISQTSAFTAPLDILDIHDAGNPTRFALDHNVGASLYTALLRSARLISRAGNPELDPTTISASVPIERLREIDMPPPPILQVLRATQNPCMLLGTVKEINQTYDALQEWGKEAVRWVVEARARCLVVENGWKWDAPPHALFPEMPGIASDRAADYTSRALEWLEQSATQPVDPSRLLEWHSSSSDDGHSATSQSTSDVSSSSFTSNSNSTDSINFGYSQALVRYDPEFAAQQVACHACHGHGVVSCEKRPLSPITTQFDTYAGFNQLHMAAPPNSLASSSDTSSADSLIFWTDDSMDCDSDMADTEGAAQD